MYMKQAGWLTITIGVFGIIISLSADLIGLGKGGIEAAQWVGAGIGVIVSLIGAAIIVVRPDQKLLFNELTKRLFVFIADMPVIYWIFAGFLCTYFPFFISPMFLNSGQHFQYFHNYLPQGDRVGMDLQAIQSLVRDWIRVGHYHYTDNGVWYPPFYNILFIPFALLGTRSAYIIMTFATIVCYFLLALVIPISINHSKNHSLLWLFFITGIISYGFQFELERGQYNIIVVLLCLLAIYIFHFRQAFRIIAYILFIIAVQLKIYPAIFIVMFIKDWANWKNNVKRILGLGLINFAFLFILGYSVFIDFVKVITLRSFIDSGSWVGNHSIKSFVSFLSQDAQSPLRGGTLTWVQQHTSFLSLSLFIYFVICFLSIISIAYLRRESGLNTYLLLACTIGMMIIPSVSYDYKLAFLVGPMSITFGNLSMPTQLPKKALSYFLVFIASVAYSATLYPFKFRPDFIANSAPLLFVILTATTLLYLLQPHPSKDTVLTPIVK